MLRHTSALELAKRSSCLLLVAVAFCFFSAATARADPLVTDPIGDTFGVGAVQLDVTSVSAVFDSTTLTFTVNFAGSVFAPSAGSAQSAYGFIEIDSDRNPATGAAPLTGSLGPGPNPELGVEYGMDISAEQFTPGFVGVYAASGASAGVAPVTFSATSFSVAVPLALLGGGNGLVNYAGVFGTRAEATDRVTNGRAPATSAAAATAVPEPATLLLLSTGLIVVGATKRRRNNLRGGTHDGMGRG